MSIHGTSLMVIPVSTRRTFLGDLAIVILVASLTCLTVFVPVLNQTPLRVLFGACFVLFVPGYAIVSALFPETGTFSETGASAVSSGYVGIDGIERAVLSFGLSIALIPLVGLFLQVLPWGLEPGPIVLSLSGLTLVATLVAVKRRQSLPLDRQFQIPYRRWVRAGGEGLYNPSTTLDGLLNVLLVLGVVVAVGSVAYTLAAPPQGEQYTEFRILAEGEDGEPVIGEYPTKFETGEAQSVILGIENNEATSRTYTVVVQLQKVEPEGEGEGIEDREEIDRFASPSIADNETWYTEHEIVPTRTGTGLRVQYLLYRGEAPDSPTRETAYRSTHLWIDVSDDSTANE